MSQLNLPHFSLTFYLSSSIYLSIYLSLYTMFTSLTRNGGRDTTFAPSPQTYATAAFREGRVREGTNLLWLRCQATAVSRVSEPAVSR